MHAWAIKLNNWDVVNFAYMQKLTVRMSGISKLVTSQTMTTMKIKVTLMMNVDMKALMKNKNN